MRLDPKEVEYFARKLWVLAIARSGLPGDALPNWEQLEESTRVAFRDQAAARLLDSGH